MSVVQSLRQAVKSLFKYVKAEHCKQDEVSTQFIQY